MEWNLKLLLYILFLLEAPPLFIPSTTFCTNEVTKGANKAEINPRFCLFVCFLGVFCCCCCCFCYYFVFFFVFSYFTVSVLPLINTLKLSNNFVIFEINTISSSPALTAPFPLIFFQVYLLQLLLNPGKLSLARGIATFVGALLPKLASQEPKHPPDWNILDIWVLLSFISVDILLAKACLYCC